MITVVGGAYVERCIQPRWNQLFGSAGRAAAALSSVADVSLFTYVDDIHRRDLEARIKSFAHVELHTSPAPRTISFDYVHPLSIPVVLPPPHLIEKQGPISVDADVVLRFGMMEGDAAVIGGRVVYDPQSAHAPELFTANGSQAESLAVVANAYEVRLLTGDDDVEAGARTLREQENAEVVVVKCGSKGALVVTEEGLEYVPAFRSEMVFSIGAGDVFAAAFAFSWGSENLSARVAAEFASKSTARYCETRSAPLATRLELEALPFSPVTSNPGRVYLAGPFFSLPERWLVEEARTHLLDMGLEVFSPIHDVGPGPAEVVAPADLKGLDECDRMLALVDTADPGTIFEVGYARARRMPIVALAETLSKEQLKMIVGSGCKHTDDFATAIYFTAWSG